MTTEQDFNALADALESGTMTPEERAMWVDRLRRAAKRRRSMTTKKTMDDATTFDRHFSVRDLSEQWRLGRETVRRLIKDEPGVVRLRLGRKKANTSYSVPETVARRVHTRLSAGA